MPELTESHNDRHSTDTKLAVLMSVETILNVKKSGYSTNTVLSHRLINQETFSCFDRPLDALFGINSLIPASVTFLIKNLQHSGEY